MSALIIERLQRALEYWRKKADRYSDLLDDLHWECDEDEYMCRRCSRIVREDDDERECKCGKFCVECFFEEETDCKVHTMKSLCDECGSIVFTQTSLSHTTCKFCLADSSPSNV